jgi:S-adenosylmethionine:tRNA ribosyltransferase-isomerase
MRTGDFDFPLPPELIAQTPANQRDASRLFVLHRGPGLFEHRNFVDLVEYLRPGDVLVLNDSRVIPARLNGVNVKTGGQFEMLLVEEAGLNDWWAMVRPGKRAREGTRITLRYPKRSPSVGLENPASGRPQGFGVPPSGGFRIGPPEGGTPNQIPKHALSPIEALVVEKNLEGHRRLRFEGVLNILDILDDLGEVPLPPYIERKGEKDANEDRERYQTVFARPAGSVAAPTAGLHFTETLLNRIRQEGIQVCFVTLHVGLGTFAPVKSESLTAHVMHHENYQLSQKTAETINRAKAAGGRIVAVGTTTLRVLETIARQRAGPILSGAGRTGIFIYPPCEFKLVDMLLTNFHLPRSTLLMLVSAFAAPGRTAGLELILASYAEAVRQHYRFFSYGDAMLIT